MTRFPARLLFIGFDYHAYTRAIDSKFRLLGFDSHFHSIQPRRPSLQIAWRLSRALYRDRLDRYHRAIIDHYPPNSFDRVIFLQAHQFSHDNLARLKERQPEARFILYNWDAISTHDYRDRLPYFDRAYTFDRSDAEAHGLGYLPLFALRSFQSLPQDGADPLSAYFVGNIVNPRRHEAVMAFADHCRANGIRFDHFLSTTVHGYTQMLKGGIRPRGVTLAEIPENRFRSMISRSAAVFDFANHQQTGFTMRTMENLCAGRKIITNNAHILHAEFYSPDRILVFEGLDFSEVKDFLQQPIARPDERFEQYWVQQFARTLAEA